MMTYLTLNLVFIAVVLITMFVLRIPLAYKWYYALVPILLLTLVFDPIIIALDIVAYDPELLLGMKLFGAPIEDFMYALLASIIVPSTWHYLAEKEESHGNN